MCACAYLKECALSKFNVKKNQERKICFYFILHLSSFKIYASTLLPSVFLKNTRYTYLYYVFSDSIFYLVVPKAQGPRTQEQIWCVCLVSLLLRDDNNGWYDNANNYFDGVLKSAFICRKLSLKLFSSFFVKLPSAN